MENNYSLAEVYKIVNIDRKAGRLIKIISKDNPKLYLGEHIVNEKVYKQFETVLKDAAEFKEIFLDFDRENYEGRNILSSRMSLIALVYDGAKSLIKKGARRLTSMEKESAVLF